jgi:hypothetical protein
MWNELTDRLGRDRQMEIWRMTLDSWRGAGLLR